MPPSTAEEPPDSPLPAPRGTTGTRCAAAQRTAVWTWLASSALTTASGVPAEASRDQSKRYFSTASGPVTTTPSGRAAVRSATCSMTPSNHCLPAHPTRGAQCGGARRHRVERAARSRAPGDDPGPGAAVGLPGPGSRRRHRAPGLSATIARGLAEQIALGADIGADYSGLRAVIVTVDGATVLERYYGCSPDDAHDVRGVTASVLSTLVGIAVADGLLRLDDRLAALLPAYAASMSRATARATLREVLTMTAGFPARSSGRDPEFTDARNWVRAILVSADARPGERFGYADEGAHLVSAILERGHRDARRALRTDPPVRAARDRRGAGHDLAPGSSGARHRTLRAPAAACRPRQDRPALPRRGLVAGPPAAARRLGARRHGQRDRGAGAGRERGRLRLPVVGPGRRSRMRRTPRWATAARWSRWSRRCGLVVVTAVDLDRSDATDQGVGVSLMTSLAESVVAPAVRDDRTPSGGPDPGASNRPTTRRVAGLGPAAPRSGTQAGCISCIVACSDSDSRSSIVAAWAAVSCVVLLLQSGGRGSRARPPGHAADCCRSPGGWGFAGRCPGNRSAPWP